MEYNNVINFCDIINIYTHDNKRSEISKGKWIFVEVNLQNIQIEKNKLCIFYEVYNNENFFMKGKIDNCCGFVTSFPCYNYDSKYFIKIEIKDMESFCYHFFTPEELDKNNINISINNKNDEPFLNIFENKISDLNYNNYNIQKYDSNKLNNFESLLSDSSDKSDKDIVSQTSDIEESNSDFEDSNSDFEELSEKNNIIVNRDFKGIINKENVNLTF